MTSNITSRLAFEWSEIHSGVEKVLRMARQIR